MINKKFVVIGLGAVGAGILAVKKDVIFNKKKEKKKEEESEAISRLKYEIYKRDNKLKEKDEDIQRIFDFMKEHYGVEPDEEGNIPLIIPEEEDDDSDVDDMVLQLNLSDDDGPNRYFPKEFLQKTNEFSDYLYELKDEMENCQDLPEGYDDDVFNMAMNVLYRTVSMLLCSYIIRMDDSLRMYYNNINQYIDWLEPCISIEQYEALVDKWTAPEKLVSRYLHKNDKNYDGYLSLKNLVAEKKKGNEEEKKNG